MSQADPESKFSASTALVAVLTVAPASAVANAIRSTMSRSSSTTSTCPPSRDRATSPRCSRASPPSTESFTSGRCALPCRHRARLHEQHLRRNTPYDEENSPADGPANGDGVPREIDTEDARQSSQSSGRRAKQRADETKDGPDQDPTFGGWHQRTHDRAGRRADGKTDDDLE